MAHRCLSLLGTPDLRIRLSWLQSSTQNGMKWGVAHSTGDLLQQGLLPEVCCTACTKGVFTKTTKYQRDPGLCALVAYIAGDTLHHQPMGAGHVTVLQLCGPMGFRVLQWCHPMLACAKRTSYCTRFITLYGT